MGAGADATRRTDGATGTHNTSDYKRGRMGTDLAIRRYRPDDRERVDAVREAALRDTGAFFEDGPGDADDLTAEYLQAGGEFLVGEANGRIVATGAFRPVRGVVTRHLDSFGDETAELKRMHVAPAHQRRGYGRRMLTELQRRARERGYAELVLVTTGPQTAAQRFYEAAGFAEAERERVEFRGEAFDAIVYRKPLPGP